MANNAIALLAKMPDFETPVESQTKALNLQQMMKQAQLGDYQLQDAQQARMDDQAMRQAFAQNGSTEDRLAALAKGGNYKGYQSLAKSDLEQKKGVADVGHLDAQSGKLKSETGTIDYDLRIKKSDQAIKDISGFATPQDAIDNLQQHIQAGDVDPQKGALILGQLQSAKTPQDFQKWQLDMVKNIMSAKEQMQYMAPDANTVANNKTSIATNAATNETSRANNASTNATTMRGQTLSDSRSREANALTREAQANVYDPERGILVNKATGLARPAATMDGSPVAPKDKPLTEFQGKSAAFGDRAMKADKILSDLTGNYSPTAVNVKQGLGGVVGIGGALEAGANMALGANSQKAEQAQRDFINALLRQESGAAISMSEFDNAKKQYFPQPGDSKEVIAQKDANRKTAIDGFVRSAGPSAKLQQPAAKTAAPAIPAGWSVKEH